MTQENPFVLVDKVRPSPESDPTPQARTGSVALPQSSADGEGAAALPAAPQTVQEVARRAFARATRNPLLGAAGPLLRLLAGLRDGQAPEDSDAQIDLMLDEVQKAESGMLAARVAPEAIRLARYILCATVDDIVLQTEWGPQSSWSNRSLLSTLYQETWGGERFFSTLDYLMVEPEENIDLLELMAVCLAFGFSGKYRVMQRGDAELVRQADSLYQTIRNVRGSYSSDLAPPPPEGNKPYRPPPFRVSPWVVAGMVALALAVGYIGVSWQAYSRAQAVMRQMVAMLPTRPALPVPPPIHIQTEIERIRAQVAARIGRGVVDVLGEPGTIVLRLVAADMFRPGGTVLAAKYVPTIRTLGKILNTEPGLLTVTGYTDSSKPGPGSPTNLQLSQQRAETVAHDLQAVLSDPSRVRWVGVGDRDPIASNATVQGRARNRRVEITLPRQAPLIP